jgi:hypothetical protein
VPRRREDTDIAVRRADLPVLRAHVRDWHLWQNNSGWLYPWLPGEDLHPDCEVPWDRALHEVDGVWYLRPEIAPLHKAHLNRPQDRADLTAAALTDEARQRLASSLELLGHHHWAMPAVSAQP